MTRRESPPRADFVRFAIAPAVAALVNAGPHLRANDGPEWVHVARVATRKLRNDLRVFGPILDATWAADVRARLKKLGRLLGAVRDADVLGERVRRLAQRLSARDEAGAAPILAYLHSTRATAAAALLLQLSAPWYAQLLETLVAAARDGPRLRVANRRVRRSAAIARIMAPPWKVLERAVRRCGSSTDVAALHRIRIRAKAVRYTADAVGPLVPRRRRAAYERFIRRIARMQDQLGELHDTALDRDALGSIPGTDPSVVGKIIALETAAGERAQRAWRTTWTSVSRRKLRFWS